MDTIPALRPFLRTGKLAQAHSLLDPATKHIKHAPPWSPCSLGGPGPAALIESFSLLAISTSFIGTILGATEFALEQLGGLQFADKGTPFQGLSADGSNARMNRAADAENNLGLRAGLKVTSSKVASRKGQAGEVGDAAVQEEIDRLQNRVRAKLAQWDSRFERGFTAGQGKNGHMYSVNKVERSSARGAHSFERGVHTSSASPVDRFALPNGLSVVNTLGLAPPFGQAGQGNGSSTEGSREVEKRLQGQTERKPEPERMGTGLAGEPSGRGKEASVGGLWSMEAPKTGRVNWALRTGAFCAVLIPPVGIASQYPDAFFQASNIAVRPWYRFAVVAPFRTLSLLYIRTNKSGLKLS